MDKNSAKISLGTAVCLVIILILMITLGVVYYLGFVREHEEVNLNLNAENANLEVENKVDDIESNINNAVKVDIVQRKSYGEPLPLDGVAKLKDGYLYYSYNNSQEPEKINGVSNIKSLDIFNIGTGINRVPFVVTQDGVVYRLNSAKQLVVYEELSKYKVDKIISHEGEVNDKFTLLLLDGTKKIVAVQENDEPIESNENEFTIVYEALYKSLKEIKNNPKKLFISNNKVEEVAILGIEINNYKYLYGNKWVSSENPDVYNDDNLIIGTCEYGLKLDTLEGLSVAGSGDSKYIGDWFIDSKIFIYNKTTQSIELATGL